jgi:hypothetical protein
MKYLKMIHISYKVVLKQQPYVPTGLREISQEGMQDTLHALPEKARGIKDSAYVINIQFFKSKRVLFCRHSVAL